MLRLGVCREMEMEMDAAPRGLFRTTEYYTHTAVVRSIHDPHSD